MMQTAQVTFKVSQGD